MRRNKDLLKKVFGVILGLSGAILVIEFVPLKFWYILLSSLVLVFIILLFINYKY